VTPTKKPFHEELGGLFLHVPLAVFGGALAAIVLGGVLSIVFSSFGIRILSRGDIYNPLDTTARKVGTREMGDAIAAGI